MSLIAAQGAELDRWLEDRLSQPAVLGFHNIQGALNGANVDEGSLPGSALVPDTVTPEHLTLAAVEAPLASTYTVTTTETDTGITYTAPATGSYLVMGTFSMDGATPTAAQTRLLLSVNGVNEAEEAEFEDNAKRVTIAQNWWLPTVTAGHVIKVRAIKSVGGSTITLRQTHSKLTIVRLG